ncbi:hypothetical protein VP01_11100g2, partial [Puccinia sorghi]
QSIYISSRLAFKTPTPPTLDREPNNSADQKPSTTAASNKIDKLEQTILKTAIETIPLLTIDNYLLWKN